MITLELTLEEVNYILMSVGKNPYVECAPLVHKIHAQAMPQVPTQVDAQAGDGETVQAIEIE
jgi:hypothetical protein